MFRRILSLTVAIILFCTLYGQDPKKKYVPFPKIPIPDIPVVYEEPEPEPVKPAYDGKSNPLSGLYDLDTEAMGKRPIAVMINNIKVATPSSGINRADMWIEMLVEGGITRIEALFADVNKIPTLGSIRSARICYARLTGKIGAIYAHIGGTPEAITLIGELGIQDLNGEKHSYYWRDAEKAKSRGSVHSCYTNGNHLQEYIEKLELDTKQPENFVPIFQFAEPTDRIPTVQDNYIKGIEVKYSGYITAEFEYNHETGLYDKKQFKAPHIDEYDNTQIAVKNVIVLEADYVPIIDGKQLDITWKNGGKYHYYCEGKAVEGEWKWNTEDSSRPFLLLDENGEEIEITAGRTWVSVIADFSSFSTIENNTEDTEEEESMYEG